MLKSAHTPANQGCGALQQCQKVGGGFFITHQELAEAVEPRVGAFDHPAAGALTLSAGASFLPALPYMRCVTPCSHGLRGRTACIALVRTQVLPPAAASSGTTTRMLSRVIASSLTSCRVAPLTIRDSGTPHRPPTGCACCLFFPRSVGLLPTASCASGALP